MRSCIFPNLRAEQARAGYTNQAMAEILGISRVAYEKKKRSGHFNVEECRKLCATFGNCEFGYLFEKAEI